MNFQVRRRLARLTCQALQAVLPPRLRSWGRAVACEVTQIPDDTQALLFALDSLLGLAWDLIGSAVGQAFSAVFGHPESSSAERSGMFHAKGIWHGPRAVGTACAVVAVVLGLGYMAGAGAPMRYLAVNAAALVIGLALAAIFRPSGAQRSNGVSTLLMGCLLLATALLGERTEGAARWVSLGALTVQPSLILLPVMVVSFARSGAAISTVGLIVAAAALAIQPDRAVAAMLALPLAVLALFRPDRHVISAFVCAALGFAVTLVRADTLPAMPYVDQILYTSFGVHVFAGLAVVGGCLLLIVPAIAGAAQATQDREVFGVFGAVWLVAILAAALGNYPTPMVGYGGSAILGYVLSLRALRNRTEDRLGSRAAGSDAPAIAPGPDLRDSRLQPAAARAVRQDVPSAVT